MSDDPLDSLDYYTLLGVDEGATTEAIKSAFRTFARKYHPDRFTDVDEEKRLRATRIFRRGSEAFQTLTEPDQRRAYDRVLAQGALRLTDDGRVSEPRISAAAAAPRRPIEPPPERAPTPAAPPVAAIPDSPIRTPEAQAYFRRAVEAAKSQDWVTAWKALRAAVQVEPGNTFLETRFQQVDAMVRNNG